MTRDEYKKIMLSKGFIFEKTCLAYPAWRGDEDIYSQKPKLKYTFRIFSMYKGKTEYGLYVGVGQQFRLLDRIVEHDIELEGGQGILPAWSGERFKQLMDCL